MPYAYAIYVTSDPTTPEAIVYSQKKITNKEEAFDLLLEQDAFATLLNFSENSITHWKRVSWLYSKFRNWQFRRLMQKM